MNRIYRFDETQLASTLWRVEDELSSRIKRIVHKTTGRKCVRILLIGGGAIALGYHAQYGTTDIDTMEAEDAFLQAWKAIKSKSIDPLPELHAVTVADAPYSFEERIRRIVVPRPGTSEKMKSLHINVPEQHDLALMKTVRGEARDEEGIKALHDAQPLDRKRLIELYRTEMSHIVGNMREFRWKFLNIYSVLFGSAEAKKLEPRLPILGIDK